MNGTLTLFSDASFDHRTGAAGWGAWCKADHMQRGRFFYGTFANKITRSSEAELCGIVNAIYAIAQAGLLEPVEHVLIQCDSIHSLSVIYHLVPGTKHNPIKNPMAVPSAQVPKHTELEAMAAARLKAMYPLTFSVRHVKAHTRRLDSRSNVNRECDRLARGAMMQKLLELKRAS